MRHVVIKIGISYEIVSPEDLAKDHRTSFKRIFNAYKLT
jgi:hypothetical protein